MKQKSLLLAMLTISMWLMVSIPFVNATNPTAIPNKSTFYEDSIGMPETVDPAWTYDTASAELIFNVYDTLIFFDYEESGTFVPKLATEWAEVTPSIDSGYHHSIAFKMRGGVEWHDSTVSTAADMAANAEYTIERWMAFDRSGGPAWMIYEALFGPGNYGADTGWANDTSNPINGHVNSNSTHVWFNFDTAYSTTIFMQVMAQAWAGILEKSWAVAAGCWDQDWSHWLDYHDPEHSPLDDPSAVMNGAGPYELVDINYGAETWELTYHPGYWGGWPAATASGYATGVKYTTVSEWSARKLRFLSDSPAAQADLTYVPRENTPELVGEIAAGRVRLLQDLPSLSLSPAMFFNFEIPTNNTYLGNEQFSEFGTPSDFFMDDDVRYMFAYAFNYAQFITDVWLGEASQPASPLIKGVGFDDLYDEENLGLKYSYDLVQAKAHRDAAWSGRLGLEGNTGLNDTGFTMTITYNTGNTARETAANMIKNALESINGKFHINVQEVPWSTYLGDLVNYPYFRARMPVFLIGWLADYPDPHNFFFPFYHTLGDFTYFQSWDKAAPDLVTVDPVTGAETPGSNSIADCDERIEYALIASPHIVRKEAYRKLMTTYHDELPTVPLIQALGRHYERTWVQGYYYNPIHPGVYWYERFKGIDADTNDDGTVNILDAGIVSTHWTGPPAGASGYNQKADIAPELSYLPTTPGSFSDGKINVLDAAYINAHWGETYSPP